MADRIAGEEARRIKRDWQKHRVSLGFAETCRALTGWKRVRETAWLKETSSTVLQQSLRHLDSAFSRFFKGSAKYPKTAPLPEVFLPGGREPKAAGLDLGLATLVALDLSLIQCIRDSCTGRRRDRRTGGASAPGTDGPW